MKAAQVCSGHQGFYPIMCSCGVQSTDMNVGYTLNEEQLHRHFSRYGNVLDGTLPPPGLPEDCCTADCTQYQALHAGPEMSQRSGAAYAEARQYHICAAAMCEMLSLVLLRCRAAGLQCTSRATSPGATRASASPRSRRRTSSTWCCRCLLYRIVLAFPQVSACSGHSHAVQDSPLQIYAWL